MGTPERELWRRKGSHTLESHLLDRKINRIGESPDAEKSAAVSQSSEKQRELNRSSELLAQSPKIEMLGWGLGTKTSAPEVSPWERAGGGGCGAETAWEV